MDSAHGKRQAVEPHASLSASKPVLLFGSKKRGLPRVIEQLCLSWLALSDLRCAYLASRDASALVLAYFSIMRELKLTDSVDDWILSMASQRCRSLTSLDLDHLMPKDTRKANFLQRNAGTLRQLSLHSKVAELSAIACCQSLEHLRFRSDEWDEGAVPKEFSPVVLPRLVSMDLSRDQAIRLLPLGNARMRFYLAVD